MKAEDNIPKFVSTVSLWRSYTLSDIFCEVSEVCAFVAALTVPNSLPLQVLERVLLTSNFGRVLYLGDGAGDFCPSTRLGPDDRIISRSVYPKGSPCNLSTMLARESARTLDAASCCQADLAGPDGAVDLQDREVFDRAAKEIASIDRGFRAQPRFWPEGCAAGVVYKWQRPEWAALLLTVLALRK